MNHDDDRHSHHINEERPKRSQTTSLGPLVIFFSFHFIINLLKNFFVFIFRPDDDYHRHHHHTTPNHGREQLLAAWERISFFRSFRQGETTTT
jgi:cytoskeletal protein RodZ